ncbi:tetratricopeptide repeat protein 23-like [Leptodactylus fuscus]|uniref:tetratricopeptide repeat protein 23-like n=1 Tax=Leptodactylus fuscus TaxID=238119 RepID=UPI003F4E4D2A
MSSVPIRIPTDSTYDEPGSLCTTLKTEPAIHEEDSSLLDYTKRSCDGSEAPPHGLKNRKLPVDKLFRAQQMAEQYTKDNALLKAHKELIRCVALSRIIHGDGHWRLAKAFAELAYSFLTVRGLPVQARQHAESAKTILLRGVDMSKSVEEKREVLGTLVTIYYTLGVSHLLQNNGRESYLSLQKVEKIVEELEELQEKTSVLGKISDKDIALAQGRACVLQEKLSLALNFFEQAVQIVVSSEGDSSGELIAIYRDMARTEQMKRRHDQAIHYLLQAHSICQAVYKNLSVEAAQTGLLLAKAYAAAAGRPEYNDSAAKYFTESLSVYRVVLGPDDPQTLNTCVEYSKWLIQIGKTQEAYKMLQEALGSETEYSETMADMLSIMGSIHLAEGRIQKGYRLLKKCLEIQMAVYGSQHNKSRETQNLLTTLQRYGLERAESKRDPAEVHVRQDHEEPPVSPGPANEISRGRHHRIPFILQDYLY